ncbi:hypothetical protein L1987_61520 [Smallanthus sonchifolius]|uniref:Uncharacterized protein n=1 Tax=Smallanthus sonchifolius TaxID=185202 RepID=A0ACB9C7Y9_9ASTR|nr:hypothetical protein L1987_61520 [Smallanthus sonchifolius]
MNLKAKVLKTMVNTENICIDFEKSDVLIVDGNVHNRFLNKGCLNSLRLKEKLGSICRMERGEDIFSTNIQILLQLRFVCQRYHEIKEQTENTCINFHIIIGIKKTDCGCWFFKR